MKLETGRSDGTRAMLGALIDAEIAGFRGLPGTLAAFRAAALAVTQQDLAAAATRWLGTADARRAALAGADATAALEGVGLVTGRLS